MNTAPNPHEQLGRLTKIVKMLDKLEHGTTATHVARIADDIQAFTAKERAEFLARCGIASASEETWALFVIAARTRTPLDHLQPVRRAS